MAEDKPVSLFEKLLETDVSKHIEKKGKFSYLSWPYAVATLRKTAPDASWRIVRFDGLPFLKTDKGVLVEVAVTVGGIELSQIHPVMDNNNRAILEPDARQINDAIMRCLVKAIALHGLGLSIYAGEDMPDFLDDGDEEEPVRPARPSGPIITDRGRDHNSIIMSAGEGKATQDLKIQYKLGKGSLDGFDEWFKKMQDKGMTIPQMGYILQEAQSKQSAPTPVTTGAMTTNETLKKDAKKDDKAGF